MSDTGGFLKYFTEEKVATFKAVAPPKTIRHIGAEISPESFLFSTADTYLLLKIGNVFASTSRSALYDELRMGSGIFYQCRKGAIGDAVPNLGAPAPLPDIVVLPEPGQAPVAPVQATPDDVGPAFFESEDNIIDTPYVMLPTTAGMYYVMYSDMLPILNSTYPFYELTPSGSPPMKYTASRNGALAGGPISNEAHCQANTSKSSHLITPIRFTMTAGRRTRRRRRAK